MSRNFTKWLLILVWAVVYVGLSQVAVGADDPNAPPVGLTGWVLGGSGLQEVRIGYEGLLPNIEFAGGFQHIDAVDPLDEEWPIRGYVIAHALSADMLASLINATAELPKGALYGGLFAEYEDDREFCGGYVIGGLVDWPGKWQTVAEYQDTVWGADEPYEFVIGLRRRF